MIVKNSVLVRIILTGNQTTVFMVCDKCVELCHVLPYLIASDLQSGLSLITWYFVAQPSLRF